MFVYQRGNINDVNDGRHKCKQASMRADFNMNFSTFNASKGLPDAWIKEQHKRFQRRLTTADSQHASQRNRVMRPLRGKCKMIQNMIQTMLQYSTWLNMTYSNYIQLNLFHGIWNATKHIFTVLKQPMSTDSNSSKRLPQLHSHHLPMEATTWRCGRYWASWASKPGSMSCIKHIKTILHNQNRCLYMRMQSIKVYQSVLNQSAPWTAIHQCLCLRSKCISLVRSLHGPSADLLKDLSGNLITYLIRTISLSMITDDNSTRPIVLFSLLTAWHSWQMHQSKGIWDCLVSVLLSIRPLHLLSSTIIITRTHDPVLN